MSEITHEVVWRYDEYLNSINWKKDGEITEFDEKIYNTVTSIDLTDEQKKIINEPKVKMYSQEHVIALHWHPEYIPMPMTKTRIDASFPNKKNELIIPTQHNELLTYGNYSGVEIDCYSREFKRKVQLLAHFNKKNVQNATKLLDILKHTFNYRGGQLFQFLDTLIEKGREDRLQLAAAEHDVNEDLIEFVRMHAKKLKELLLKNEITTPPAMIKNKLLRNYFNALTEKYDSRLIDKIQVFLKAVKKVIKGDFNYEYFYLTQEIIEEVRHYNGGLIVPHPEQFWPILLADYDIDGYEVWNPQSQAFTEFLIDAVKRISVRNNRKPLLLTMGDDCHLGEKLVPLDRQDPEKASREIGIQPAWEDISIRKTLIKYSLSREQVISEYKERLG